MLHHFGNYDYLCCVMGKNINRESVFRFKRFQVKNHNSAMKVGTDGVLLGAWSNTDNAQSVLDIGCGTGLISLMIAQRCEAKITGIEIDELAADECKYNFDNSPWKERLLLVHADFNSLQNGEQKYDLIISNPPFFTNGITAPDKSRATARHCETLNYDSLIAFATKHLSDTGRLAFIAPADKHDEIVNTITMNKLHILRQTDVYSKPSKDIAVRTMWEISPVGQNSIYSSLYIHNDDNTYHNDYISLTKDFYLNF